MSQEERANKKDKEVEIDFDAFERQIDLEIDKLFVPSEDFPADAAQAQKIGTEKEEVQDAIEMEAVFLDDSDILSKEEPAHISKEPDLPEISFTAEEIEFVSSEEPVEFSPSEELVLEEHPRESVEAPEPQSEVEHAPVLSAELEIELSPPEQTLEPVALEELEIEFSQPDGSFPLESMASQPVEPADPFSASSELHLSEIRSDLPDETPEQEISLSEFEEQPMSSLQKQAPDSGPISAFAETPQISLQMESFEQMPTSSDEPEKQDERGRFIDALDSANLSLARDCSAANLSSLETAIQNLQPYWNQINEAAYIVKVLRAVLLQLKTRPDSASPALIDFISDALELLKSLVQSDTKAGPAEKAQLKNLVDRLAAIRGGKTAAAEEAKTEIPPSTPPVVTVSPEVPSSADTFPQPLQISAYEEMLAQPYESDDLDELGRFVEAVDIASLSLDWDFSTPNLSLLEKAIADLEPYWNKIPEATSTVKILRAVLLHLKSRPDSASPALIDFISDSLELLKSLVQSDTRPGPGQRAQLKNLIDRLHSIKASRAPAVPETKTEIPLPTPQVVSAVPDPISQDEPPPTAPTVNLDALVGLPLRELREWMVSFRERSEQALQKLDEETKRLLQLEQTIGKKPALNPVTSRITKIRLNVEEYITASRQSEPEWANRVESLFELERSFADMPAASTSRILAVAPTDSSSSPLPCDVEPLPRSEEAVAEEPTESPASVSFAQTMVTATQSRQELVCLFEAGGNHFALPASNVIKIEKLPEKKARKLMNRGYATLDDFKPLFKSLKTGLMGSFMDLPAKDLKGYQFLTLPLDMMAPDQTDAPEPSLLGGVILVSNMQYHAMIFTEASEASIHSETIEMSSQDETTLGVIQTADSLSSTKVLNIDLLLRKLHE